MNAVVLDKYKVFVLCLCGACTIMPVNGVELTTEPELNFGIQYDDNVRLLSISPESSTAYTLSPAVKFVAEEHLLWDVSFNARGKMTRFQDVEDIDSDNVLLELDGGSSTELTALRLKLSLDKNSNFDTDFDSENPDSGLLLDDRTERITKGISPSFMWSINEVTQLMLNYTRQEVSFDDVTNLSYSDYSYESIQVSPYWQFNENNTLGLTSSYSEYENPDANYAYQQSVLQFDYIYTINEITKFNLSLGVRKIETKATDVTVACQGLTVFPVPEGGCPDSLDFGFLGVIDVVPVLDDVEGEDEGAVVSLSYLRDSEITSHNISASRTVIPSSFGSAQEKLQAIYQFNMKNTERLSTRLILDASETETLGGLNSATDRKRARFVSTISYKLSRNWDMRITYQYLEQEFKTTGDKGVSNAVLMYLDLKWPKLASTY